MSAPTQRELRLLSSLRHMVSEDSSNEIKALKRRVKSLETQIGKWKYQANKYQAKYQELLFANANRIKKDNQ